MAVGLVLGARFLAVGLPYRLAKPWLTLDEQAPLVMTWGGLRSGISVALARSISDAVSHKPLIVAITYAVVLFSVIIQGLNLEHLTKRLYPADADKTPTA